MHDSFKVAGCQIDIELMNVSGNLQKISDYASRAQREGALLVVFPECAVSGYCFDSRAESQPYAETIPGPSTDKLAEVAKSLGIHLIFGMLESDGEQIFNTCVILGPKGLVAKYRKIHLPFLGVDRFNDAGNEGFKIHSIDNVKVGPIICYDGSFPESARSLTLQGADLVVLPTNWPVGSEGPATFMSQTRAWENHIYFMPVNRVGTERKFRFIGQSKICDPLGKVISGLSETEEGIFYATIQPSLARKKQMVAIPGKFELNRIKDRRPKYY